MNLFKLNISYNRNFGLDLLRFLAIFIVLLNHSTTVLPKEYNSNIWFILDGVMLFFVLSGFLIGRILIGDFSEKVTFNKITIFWRRRWLRTLPAYYFTIILVIIMTLILKKEINFSQVIKSVFFVQNINYSNNTFFPEAWSLSIEEWFYLGIPILIFFNEKILKLSIKKNILVVVIFIVILSLIIRYYDFINYPISNIFKWDKKFRSTIITRLDSIVIGVLAAWIYIYKREMFYKYKKFAFLFGLALYIGDKLVMLYFGFNNIYGTVFYFLINSVAVFLTLPFLYYLKSPSSIFLKKIITYGSLISYSMYLLNSSFVSYLILQEIELLFFIKYFLFWILTIGFSILMYKYIEIPFMKMR